MGSENTVFLNETLPKRTTVVLDCASCCPNQEWHCIVADTVCLFTAALALRSRGLVIGSREKEREEKEEKNLQIAIRCLWDLFD